jgi:hypothetical protein
MYLDVKTLQCFQQQSQQAIDLIVVHNLFQILVASICYLDFKPHSYTAYDNAYFMFA